MKRFVRSITWQERKQRRKAHAPGVNIRRGSRIVLKEYPR